ncbi:hypothetical protein [Lactiplantibacillus carotarum]|uniref:hypothetical protein n=1 Tax=Lactiplantibacillus carotarum TaxID=2993456 RepID=UPI00298EE8F3|nr:hypothetical protein [Lactiplantibacillus carotarum]
MNKKFILRPVFQQRGWTKSDLNTANWKTVNKDILTEKSKISFKRRCMAVDLLINSDRNVIEIEKITQIKRHHIYDFVSRCLEIHPDGDVWGYRALVPYRRFATVVEDKSIQTIMNNHPQIEEEINAIILGKNRFQDYQKRNL